jgi:hypothetical protein
MTTTTPDRVTVHPPLREILNDPWYDEDDFDDDECTEGMSIDRCIKLCTREAKRAKLCVCKRKRRGDEN